MSLLHLDRAHLAYGHHVLLDEVTIDINRGQRIGLLGRNGAGKSTFLKILKGDIQIDSGEFRVSDGIKIAYLDQNLPAGSDQDVFDFVASGLPEAGKLLSEYHHLLSGEMDDRALGKLEKIQQQIESIDGWQLNTQVEKIIEKLKLPAEKPMNSLSGGWRRRVDLARALVCEPDLLMLDEPTNHLDIPTIEWLEQQLNNFQGALLFITHDRHFLQQIANSIWELDRGDLRQWQGDYKGFLAFREQQLAAEETANALFDKKLAEEEKWIRQGIKARRTRNEGRVRALKAMRNERAQRREKTGKAEFAIEAAERSGKLVIEASHLHFEYGQEVIVDDFSTVIMRGDRIGIIGANGAGKTTLLNMLLGKLLPQSGTVKTGTKLEIAYFDQLRDSLDMEKNVIDNLAEGREFIEINNKKRHAISYLQDFLFAPERTRQPVSALSGGEQNRLILAKLFSKPANLLVLDEPTNDLDMETLELLEELLTEFNGTLIIVSHDREFMDNVVTNIIALEGNGVINEYVGSYSDWVRKGGGFTRAKNTSASNTHELSASSPVPPEKNKNTDSKKAKLSYKDQRELNELPGKIEKLEADIEKLTITIAQPDFYQGEHQLVEKTLAELDEKQASLDQLIERWAELENQSIQ
ncbi:MAG: ATP-binding cassette domain-containing protein [Pseudomonadales bacterium]|nr:ATP-binding cassette domain-containing protein [Pseudomonadales bacterium]